jgi:acetyl esterase/lipase
VSRQSTSDGKTVIFLHGGGWTTGGRGSLVDEAAAWAAAGWVVVNASYRVGVADGIPDDGKQILADVEDVLNTYRAKSYVDPSRVVVYGESAGGHLATWLGAKDGAKVKAIIALSPVSSISGAIAAGQAPGAPANVLHLGEHAQEFFGYSVGTTDAHRYLDRVQHARIVVGVDPLEWVDPDIHGRAFCLALGAKCHLDEIPGGLHGGAIAAANPQLVIDLRHWAETQVG